MMLSPGAKLDRYEIVRSIGQGGMAEVFEVRHLDLGTRHALKVLQVHAPALFERLLTEGRIQAGLHDRHVCRVTDVIRVGEAPGLVMELVDGPPLELLLAHYQPNLHQIDQLARGVFAGVCAAHAAGLVHRDLKPANILLAIDDHEGPPRIVPKVVDYGLARTLGELGSGGVRATRSGITMGTPCYMAPEQFRNAKHADQRSDQFSVGCLLYELVSGMRPFDGETPLEVYERSSIGAFRPVREVAPNLPGRMADAITRALSPRPDDRFQDCRTMFDAWCDGVDDGALLDAWEPAHLALVKSLVAPPASLVRSTASLAEPVGLTAVPSPADQADSSPPRARPTPAPIVRMPTTLRTVSPTRSTVARMAGLSVSLAAFATGLAIAGAVAAALTVGAVFALRRDVPTPTAPAAETSADPAAVTEPPPAPEPEPEPAPPQPVAAPARSPVAEPAPEPAPAPIARVPAPSPAPPPRAPTVEVVGVDRAWLVDDAGATHRPGSLPPGRYTLQVFFVPERAARVLTFDLGPDEHKEIRCEPSLGVCR